MPGKGRKIHLSLSPFHHGLNEFTLAHSYLWKVSAKQWQFGGGFKCLILFFLFFLLCLVSDSKLRLAEEGEGGKGKLSTTMLSLEELGNVVISRGIFQWPFICSPWFLVPNHLSVKVIKIQQSPWIWLQHQLWSWNWLRDHPESLDADRPAAVMKALTCRLRKSFGGRSHFWRVSQRGHHWTPLRQSCSALVCMIPHHSWPECKISDIQPVTFKGSPQQPKSNK